MDSPASHDPQTPADDDTDDDPEYVDYCPYPETTSATDSLPELSALPKASTSMAGHRSPTPPTATWSWSSSSGDGNGDDNDYRGVVDDCSEAVVRHVRRTMNTCCSHRCQHGLRKMRESARNDISRTHANFARAHKCIFYTNIIRQHYIND